MSDQGNDLSSLFPADGEVLHRLKLESPHFRRLAEEHHELTKEIDRIEEDIEPGSDERLEALKKQRLAALDGIAALIAEAKAG